jgi:hypothetical protein
LLKRRAAGALVDIEASLVPAANIDQETRPIFYDFYQGRRLLAEQQADCLRDPFFAADIDIAALVNADRVEQVVEYLRDFGFAAIDPQGERLQDQVIAIAIDHKAWQAIIFGVDQPVDVGAALENRGPRNDSTRDPIPPPGGIYGLGHIPG